MLQRTWRLPSVVALSSPGALRRLLANPLDLGLPVARRRKAPVLDDFRIVAVVGEGNFGIVYEALDLRQNQIGDNGVPRRCALKILHRTRYRMQAMVDRARRERYVLKAAKHPFVVRLFSAFRTPAKELALVMEFCPYGNLNDFLVRKGTPGLPLEFSRRLLAEIVLALEYLHDELDIIFRDLKPENVILDAALHAKLTDFGLVKLNATTDDDGASSFVGTRRYVAPEVTPDEKETYTASVDLYALGLVAWVCFTGGLKSTRDGFTPRSTASRDHSTFSREGGDEFDVEAGAGGGNTQRNGDDNAVTELRLPPESHEALRAWLAEHKPRSKETDVAAAPNHSVRAGETRAAPAMPLAAVTPTQVLPKPPPGLPASAIALMEQLTSTSSEERGFAVKIKEHEYFRLGKNPPLATEQDWKALLPVGTPREDGDACSERSASSAGTWSWQVRDRDP
jgi:serine/threonine protein kinase